MSSWYLLTLVGKDRPGIVAGVTTALYKMGANLGEASMVQLGGNFTIMVLAQYKGTEKELSEFILPVAKKFDLRLHIDSVLEPKHQTSLPDVRITVYGADRSGIVAEATTALANAGLNILNLESDVGGGPNSIYILIIEGTADKGIDALQKVLDDLARDKKLETRLSPIDTLIG